MPLKEIMIENSYRNEFIALMSLYFNKNKLDTIITKLMTANEDSIKESVINWNIVEDKLEVKKLTRFYLFDKLETFNYNILLEVKHFII